MKTYGLDLQFSEINKKPNITILASVAFPINPEVGEVFFLTTTNGTNSPGQYVYDGNLWIANGDITSITASDGLLGGGTAGAVTLSVDSSTVITRSTLLAMSGDLTTSGLSDLTSTLSASGVTPGTYNKVTVDAKGRVTNGENVNTISQVITGSIPITSGTTSIPFGDVAPLISDGTEIMSQVITPISATSDIAIDCAGMIDTGTANRSITIAVFRGSVFIGGVSNYFPKANNQYSFALKLLDAPGDTSAVTYSIRIGTSNSSSTWYVGRGGSSTLGGVNPTCWTISEIL